MSVQKLVKRLGVVLVLIGVVIFLYNPDNVFAKNDFDVRTELSDGVTVESAQERLEKLGKGKSPFHEKMDFIFDESLDRGINPVYILGIMSLESDYGLSYRAEKHHNYGGIGGSNGRKYKDEEEGLLAVIDLIHTYITDGINGQGPKYTIGDIKKQYCPSNDGCNPNYVTDVLSIMKGFGQEIEGDLLDGDYERDDTGDKNDGDNKTAKGAEEFKEREYAKSTIGLDDKSNFIGGDLFLVIQNTSSLVVKTLMYIGVFLVGLLLLFTATSVAGYMVLSTYGGSTGAIKGFEKITGTSLERSREAMIKLLGRWIIVVVVITIFLTGLYSPIMTGLLSFLENIVNYIFGLGG